MTTNRLRNFASILDDTTRRQAEALAALPIVDPHIALMPDAHAGKGSSVGTVIPTFCAVIPAAVGVDIGCGTVAVRTAYTRDDLDDLDDRMAATGHGLDTLRAAIEAAIPLSPGNYNRSIEREHTAERIDSLERDAEVSCVDLTHSPKWREQLGSLGGGNHFIELCLDTDGTVWLFLHSGSRGVGNKIAQRHIRAAQAQRAAAGTVLADRDHAWLDEGTDEFDHYLRELIWAQQFALFNRADMMDRFVTVFADWAGVDPATVEQDRIDTPHNYISVCNIDGPTVWDNRTVWLTRKGAIDATTGTPGLIPGPMGTPSYVVRGKGNPDALWSAPHGAGRVLSRTQAKKQFTADDLADRMRGIEYRHGDEWIDEIPDAYKPITTVMADAAPLVEVTHELRRILNVKGT